MKKTNTIWLLLLALCSIFASCKKDKITNSQLAESEKLPPITQTGANTFGCLVNGIAWLPNGTKPQSGGSNIELYVDPTFQGGAFYVTGHQYNGPYQTVAFGSSKCINGGYFTSDSSFNSVDYKKLFMVERISNSGHLKVASIEKDF